LKRENALLKGDSEHALQQFQKDIRRLRTTKEQEIDALRAQLAESKRIYAKTTSSLDKDDFSDDNLTAAIALTIKTLQHSTIPDEALSKPKTLSIKDSRDHTHPTRELPGLGASKDSKHCDLSIDFPAETVQEIAQSEPAIFDDVLFHNLSTLIALRKNPGAKLWFDENGFELQKAGLFSQTLPRMFSSGISILNDKQFANPIRHFFRVGKEQLSRADLQQAFLGVCSMRATYVSNSEKTQILDNLISCISKDNPALKPLRDIQAPRLTSKPLINRNQ
ncbi:MAG: hypothetical protein VYA34_02690, partial [Myxococcota bacterium]|nr:hypothetical protein [Myxococcota bacterium]